MSLRLQTEPNTLSGAFDLPSHLEGELAVEGKFTPRFGNKVRRFSGRATGTWHQADFVLDEVLKFDDGQSEERTWRLTFDEDGNFTSTCVDVVGYGVGRHTLEGCTHTYLFTLPVGRNALTVRIRELFARGDEGALLCQAKLSKWGLPVGELCMEFRRAVRTNVRSPSDASPVSPEDRYRATCW